MLREPARRTVRWLGVTLTAALLAVPAHGGMAELGRSGTDTATGSGKVKLQVNPTFTFAVAGGETVSAILEDFETQINTHPQQAWTATHTSGSNVIQVFRRDGTPINLRIDVEGSSFPEEAAQNTGFDRVRVDGDSGVATIAPTDAPAGDGGVTVTLNGTAIGVSTVGHDAGTLQSALAAAIVAAGFELCDCQAVGIRVLDIHDVMWEDTDSGIDTFGVGIMTNTGAVTCNTQDSGVATACDASDSITIGFQKPGQSGNLDGFDLFLKTVTTNPPPTFGPRPLSSPVISGATCLVKRAGWNLDAAHCSMTDAGAPTLCDQGDLVTIVESPVFVPGARQVGFYIVAHSQFVAQGPAPADHARPGVTGTGINGPVVPRFVEPLCP